MRIADYPYAPSAELKSAVKWLNKNKRKLCKRETDGFDYPDYWGMPASISGKLTNQEVDWIQEETYAWWAK